MSIQAWILIGLLAVVLVVCLTQFRRIIFYILSMHRDERRERAAGMERVITDLTQAIRDANAGTATHNTFHGPVETNQGHDSIKAPTHNQHNSGGGQGNQGHAINNPSN